MVLIYFLSRTLLSFIWIILMFQEAFKALKLSIVYRFWNFYQHSMITQYILLHQLIVFKHDIALLSITFHKVSWFNKVGIFKQQQKCRIYCNFFIFSLIFLLNLSSYSLQWKKCNFRHKVSMVFTASWNFIFISAEAMLQEKITINLWFEKFMQFFFTILNMHLWS